LQFTTPVKDDICKLADIKRQISEKKMIQLIQYTAKMSLCCKIISFFRQTPTNFPFFQTQTTTVKNTHSSKTAQPIDTKFSALYSDN